MWTVYRFKPTLILQNFSSNTKAGINRTHAIDEKADNDVNLEHLYIGRGSVDILFDS